MLFADPVAERLNRALGYVGSSLARMPESPVIPSASSADPVVRRLSDALQAEKMAERQLAKAAASQGVAAPMWLAKGGKRKRRRAREAAYATPAYVTAAHAADAAAQGAMDYRGSRPVPARPAGKAAGLPMASRYDLWHHLVQMRDDPAEPLASRNYAAGRLYEMLTERYKMARERS